MGYVKLGGELHKNAGGHFVGIIQLTLKDMCDNFLIRIKRLNLMR